MIITAREPGKFQHTAARRRLGKQLGIAVQMVHVSTHSRPKAAGFSGKTEKPVEPVSTHSRPKAAGFTRSATKAY